MVRPMVEEERLESAIRLIDAASAEGIPIRLLGGLAVRYLCPLFPARTAEGQDLDLASVSPARRALSAFLENRGFVPDKEFNALYGHKQMYFRTPDDAHALDVIVDRLDMCHVLDFRERIDRLPETLDVADLLLSKLQVVELNEKDVHDLVHLLSAFPVQPGDDPGTIGTERIGSVVAGDWGWWRTVTMNLDKLAHFAADEHGDLVPEARRFEPAEQARRLREHCDQVPKPFKWKLRAKVGDRVQWYQLPEEVGH